MVGGLSDRKGRKPFIALGLFMGVFTSMGFMAANSILFLIAVRACQGIGGAMVGPVSQAYAGKMTAKGGEAFAMGSLNTAGWVGFGLGPVCAGLIKDGWGMDGAFAIRGILCLAGLCICLFFLPADLPAVTRDKELSDQQGSGIFAKLTAVGEHTLTIESWATLTPEQQAICGRDWPQNLGSQPIVLVDSSRKWLRMRHARV